MTVKKPLVINQPEVGNLIRELRQATGLTPIPVNEFLKPPVEAEFLNLFLSL